MCILLLLAVLLPTGSSHEVKEIYPRQAMMIQGPGPQAPQHFYTGFNCRCYQPLFPLSPSDHMIPSQISPRPMHLFLDVLSQTFKLTHGCGTWHGHEAIRGVDTRRLASSLRQMLPNLSLTVDPLALPSLRSLLLGSRFTVSLSKIYALSRCLLYTGYARQQRLITIRLRFFARSIELFLMCFSLVFTFSNGPFDARMSTGVAKHGQQESFRTTQHRHGV